MTEKPAGADARFREILTSTPVSADNAALLVLADAIDGAGKHIRAGLEKLGEYIYAAQPESGREKPDPTRS